MREFLWYPFSAVCGLSAWRLYDGANGDLLQEGLYHILHVSGLRHLELLSPWQATADLCLCRRHSNTERQVWLSLFGVSGSWCTQGFVWALWASLQIWGLILNVVSSLLLSCWGFSFALRHGVSFLGGIQYSPVDGCSGSKCNFGVFTGEDELISFYSAIWH